MKLKLSSLFLNILFCVIIFFYILFCSTEQMLLSSFVIVLFYLIFYLSINVVFLSTSFFFILFYIMLFFVQPIIIFILGYSYEGYSIADIKTMTFLVNLGILFFCLGHSLIGKRKIFKRKHYISRSSVNKAIFYLLVSTILSFILIFWEIGTLNILLLSRLQLKVGGLGYTIATYGFYIASIMYFLVSYTSNSRKTIYNLLWLAVFIVFEILLFLLYRTRSLMVVHGSALLVGYYYRNTYGYTIKREGKTNKLSILLFAIVIFVLAISSRFFRGYLQPNVDRTAFQFDFKLFLQESVINGDLGYTKILLDVIDYVPNFHPYLLGQSYYRMLFIFIPRAIWPNKPINTETLVASWFYPGEYGLSIPPGVIGDTYINFGVFGIFSLILFGFLFGLLDSKYTIKNFMIWGVSATWIFHLVRGGFTNPILIFLVLLIVISILNKYILDYS